MPKTLTPAQSELAREVLRDLYRTLGDQKAVAKAVGVSQQTISKEMRTGVTTPVGLRLAKSLADRGFVDLASLLSTPPRRFPLNSGDPIDAALLSLVYEKPMKATAYVEAALEQKSRQASFIGREQKPLTTTEAVNLIRIAVGEIRPTEPDEPPANGGPHS